MTAFIFALLAVLGMVATKLVRTREAFLACVTFAGVMMFSAIMNFIPAEFNHKLERGIGIVALITEAALAMLLSVGILRLALGNSAPSRSAQKSTLWFIAAGTLVAAGACANMYSVILGRVLMALGVCIFVARRTS